MNNLIKCKRIAKQIRDAKVDLLFVQETHIRAQEEKYLLKNFKGQMFHTSATTKTNVVLIGISSNLGFKVEKIELDQESRYIILKGYLDAKLMAFVNIYGPNGQQLQQEFFQALITRLVDYEEVRTWIMAGDLNGVMDPNKDRTGTRNT